MPPCLYSGMWEDDKASGPGTLEYHNGDVYEGDWESDQRNGTAQYSTLIPRLSYVIFTAVFFALSCGVCSCVIEELHTT